MSLPQIIILCLVLYSFVKSAVNDNRVKPQKNFYLTAPIRLIEVAALSWGGFFANWSWPQTIFIALWLGDTAYQALAHGTVDGSRYSLVGSLLSVLLIYLPLLWAGGFFG